jgi:hypothetical protein
VTLTGLRVRIAGLWAIFWVITCTCVVLAPVLRADKAIGFEQVTGVLGQISGIWLPPLSCFSAFWFPAAERKAGSKKHVNSERILGAMMLTTIFMVLVLVLLLLPLYFIKYEPNAVGDLDKGQSLTERISEMVKFSLLLSPLVLAPISWLTAGHSEKSQEAQDVS